MDLVNFRNKNAVAQLINSTTPNTRKRLTITSTVNIEYDSVQSSPSAASYMQRSAVLNSPNLKLGETVIIKKPITSSIEPASIEELPNDSINSNAVSNGCLDEFSANVFYVIYNIKLFFS